MTCQNGTSIQGMVQIDGGPSARYLSHCAAGLLAFAANIALGADICHLSGAS
jgi:hypothetical protein